MRRSSMLRSCTLILFLTAWLICIPTTSLWAQEKKSFPTRPLPVAKLQLQGDLRNQIDTVIDNWLLVAPQLNPQMLGMYRQRDRQPYNNLLPWSGEFAGKYLTACVEMLRVSDHAKLREHTKQFVEDLLACQDADGYFGPFPKEHRLTGWAPNVDGRGGDTWDAWGHYHVMLGLLSWYKLTSDQPSLQAASKIADLLNQKFSGPDRTILSTRSPEMNQAVIHSLALLYEQSPQERYLNLAREVVEEFALPGAGDYLNAGLSNVEFYKTPKPRWESLHPLLGLAELYWITGNEDYRKAVVNLWWSITKLDRHNNGGFSSGEQAQGDPYHPGAIETCCTIAWMALSTAVLHMTNDSRVADELELSLFNQVRALHGPDGSWCTYNTPMDGTRINSTTDIAFQRRPGSEELNCCSVNAARGFGLTSDWGVVVDSKGLTINYYGESSITTDFDGANVQVQQETAYPNDSLVNLKLTLDHPTFFRCRLRIPHWSHNTLLKVNGENVAVQAGQYAEIERQWRTGDTIQLQFDFALRVLAGENACANMISIYRGPLLLAMDTPTPKIARHSEQFKNYGSLFAASEPNAWVEYDFNGPKVSWNGMRFDDAGIARVLIDGKEVATVDQYAPQRGVPFQWSYDRCGDGPHKLRIEVTDDKAADSKNTFINFVDFAPKQQRPRISKSALANASSKTADEIVRLGVKADDGSELKLVPYSNAGRAGAYYVTWFASDDFSPIPFTRQSPSRTFSVASP